jgi:hypothetical protein
MLLGRFVSSWRLIIQCRRRVCAVRTDQASAQAPYAHEESRLSFESRDIERVDTMGDFPKDLEPLRTRLYPIESSRHRCTGSALLPASMQQRWQHCALLGPQRKSEFVAVRHPLPVVASYHNVNTSFGPLLLHTTLTYPKTETKIKTEHLSPTTVLNSRGLFSSAKSIQITQTMICILLQLRRLNQGYPSHIAARHQLSPSFSCTA